ncbi:MAG TPA: hypothetical protein VIO58_10265 [Candidatus Methanoperedens sp.]
MNADKRRFIYRLTLRLIDDITPQRARRTQSMAAMFFATFALLYNNKLPQRQRTRMTRIARIFTDMKSVCIRVIRAIRVLSHLKLTANNGFNQKSEIND